MLLPSITAAGVPGSSCCTAHRERPSSESRTSTTGTTKEPAPAHLSASLYRRSGLRASLAPAALSRRLLAPPSTCRGESSGRGSRGAPGPPRPRAAWRSPSRPLSPLPRRPPLARPRRGAGLSPGGGGGGCGPPWSPAGSRRPRGAAPGSGPAGAREPCGEAEALTGARPAAGPELLRLVPGAARRSPPRARGQCPDSPAAGPAARGRPRRGSAPRFRAAGPAPSPRSESETAPRLRPGPGPPVRPGRACSAGPSTAHACRCPERPRPCACGCPYRGPVGSLSPDSTGGLCLHRCASHISVAILTPVPTAVLSTIPMGIPTSSPQGSSLHPHSCPRHRLHGCPCLIPQAILTSMLASILTTISMGILTPSLWLSSFSSLQESSPVSLWVPPPIPTTTLALLPILVTLLFSQPPFPSSPQPHCSPLSVGQKLQGSWWSPSCVVPFPLAGRSEVSPSPRW